MTCYLSWSLASAVLRREHRYNIIMHGLLRLSSAGCKARRSSPSCPEMLGVTVFFDSCQAGADQAVIAICVAHWGTFSVITITELYGQSYRPAVHYSCFFWRIKRRRFLAFCRDVHAIWWRAVWVCTSLWLYFSLICFQFAFIYFVSLQSCLQYPCLPINRGRGSYYDLPFCT